MLLRQGERRALESGLSKERSYDITHQINSSTSTYRKSELDRFEKFITSLNNKTISFVETTLRYRIPGGNEYDVDIWLGFPSDSRIFDVIRSDYNQAVQWFRIYFKTVLEEYKEWNMNILRINAHEYKDSLDKHAEYNKFIEKYHLERNVDLWKLIDRCDPYNNSRDKEFEMDSRHMWGAYFEGAAVIDSADIIVNYVQSTNFYVDRATQFFTCGNYVNPSEYWDMFDRPDINTWTLFHYDRSSYRCCYDYRFAGQRFKISRGILYFKENVPERVYKKNSIEYSYKYHTELHAVKLIDFEYLGKVKEYAVLDKSAPFVPEEYWTEYRR